MFYEMNTKMYTIYIVNNLETGVRARFSKTVL